MHTNITLYPWLALLRNLLFFQAVWFLYFQSVLTPAEAILLYVIGDLATTVLEVPSGYASDRWGRRITLILAMLLSGFGALLLGVGQSFFVLAVGQILLGAGNAFVSGTDSALLYESLVAQGRASEVERHEVKATRFMFIGLSVSALIGGAVAIDSAQAPFLLTGLCMLLALFICWRLTEPAKIHAEMAPQPNLRAIAALRQRFAHPVLIWLFVLSVLMYSFGHVPYVFGQPYIQAALSAVGLADETPLVSGAITAGMMTASVLVSVFSPRIRRSLGLPGLLLLAFSIQIGLCGLLALSQSPWVILVLLMRMIPSVLSRPFILARTQSLLADNIRATYLSLQSLIGRLVFGFTLYFAATVSQQSELSYSELQVILSGYVALGVACLLALAIAARKIRIEQD